MTNVDQNECAQLLELTSALCRIEDAGELPQHLLQALQKLIPHELGACHRLQPTRRQIAPCYSPCRRPLPAAHQDFWRLTDAHPLNPLLVAHPARAWKLTDAISRRDFHRTELYEVLYRPIGVDCELSARVGDESNGGSFLLLSLHRQKADFSERDREVMNLILPHVAGAWHRLSGKPSAKVNWLSDETRFHEWLPSHTPWGLSRREIDVLFWLCQGKTNDEIGSILGISGRTAETHTLRVYPKLGVENRYAAIAALHQLAAQPAG